MLLQHLGRKISVHGSGGCEPGIKVPWRLVSGERSLVDGYLPSKVLT